MDEIDGYKEFFKLFNIDLYQFYEFGLSSTELIRNKDLWEELKNNINSKSDNIYIRQYSRNGLNSNFYTDFYKMFCNITINFDSSNNDKPTKLITEKTKFTKKEYKQKDKQNEYTLIKNYQVAHVFAKTKNIYCFLAPWNIVYIPKIIDPFTGHEAKGKSVKDYTNIFRGYICNEFSDDINDFNKIMDSKEHEIKMALKEVKKKFEIEIDDKFGSDIIKNKSKIEHELKKYKNFKESIDEQFSTIPIVEYIALFNKFKENYKLKYNKNMELTKSLSLSAQ